MQKNPFPLSICRSAIQMYQFLGAFAKLRKATISFVMSVRPSVCMEQLDFRPADFHEI